MKSIVIQVGISIAFLMARIPGANSQTYGIDWSTVDGGGGAISGGGYSLNGTIGQADAGAMSGGSYSIVGGFWSGIVGPSGPRPGLSIRFAGPNTVVLSWLNPSTGYVLQQTANMNAPGGGWTDVTTTPVV